MWSVYKHAHPYTHTHTAQKHTHTKDTYSLVRHVALVTEYDKRERVGVARCCCLYKFILCNAGTTDIESHQSAAQRAAKSIDQQ